MSESPEKPVIQVPDSSPPQQTATKNNLSERFSFNGYDLMKKIPSFSDRDLEILKKLFPTVSENLIKVVYNSKTNHDLKQSKAILTNVIEKRKQTLMLNPPQPQVINISSEPSNPLEITSSPNPSPRKSISSSKVILEKKKTISEKYSHNLNRAEIIPHVAITEEPIIKKRRLVRGSKAATPVSIDSPSPDSKKDIIDLSEEEEAVLDNDSDSDVDEGTLNNNNEYYQEQVLNFFNTVEEREIIDVTSCDVEIARNIIKKRPFRSLTYFETLNFRDTEQASNKKKPDGENLSLKTELVLRGYKAVETLVDQCNAYSDQIAKEINKWGVKVHGINEELEIVEVDVDSDDDKIITVGSKKVKYIRNKPKLLSDDIELKNYQQVGLNWLYLLYTNKLSCILADEMGLGKTCQVISFLSYLKEQDVKGPHLVVVPSSTLENWMREFKKFSPSLIIEPYYGSQAARFEMRRVLYPKLDEIDVIVTTYNLATGSKDDHSFLKNAGFNVVVYDEGHMLKNSMSDRFHKLMKIKSKFRLLLTGTPLQNNLRELMSLLEFILPSLFVSKKEDLKYVFSQKASTKDNKKGFNPLLSERAIANAKKMMAPFILRRRKDQVLQHLPKKHNLISVCELTKTQKELYLKQVEIGRKLKLEKKSKMTNILMNLRKAAIHPLLFRSVYNDEVIERMTKDIMKEEVYLKSNKEAILEDMSYMTDFELHNLCLKFPTVNKYKLLDDEFLTSGKVLKLKELLDKLIVVEDGKVLIFSLFTQVLDILENVLSLWSIKFLRLDGSTAVDIRQDIIDKFYQEDTIPVFLLSTKAGGFGINLVCANNVIIFDQSFNPHDDKQAEDRAHRVGQEREVNVFRMISKGTIEENMYLVAKNKLELDQSMSGEQIENKTAAVIDDMIFNNKMTSRIELVDGEEEVEEQEKQFNEETNRTIINSKLPKDKPQEPIEID